MPDEVMPNQSSRVKKVLVYVFYFGAISFFLLVVYVGVQQCCLMKY